MPLYAYSSLILIAPVLPNNSFLSTQFRSKKVTLYLSISHPSTGLISPHFLLAMNSIVPIL